jgi:hypothetical protein
MVQLTAGYTPESAADAVQAVSIVENILPQVEQELKNGKTLDPTPIEKLNEVQKQGIDYWKLDADTTKDLTDVAKGARPAEFTGTDKDWYNTGLAERRDIKQQANKRLHLSEDIDKYHENAQKQATLDSAHQQAIEYAADAQSTMREHVQSVADTAYEAKKAEIQASIDARLEKARTNPHLTDNARHTIITAIEQERESATADAAESAARDRQAVIDANGGATGVTKLLTNEARAAQAEAEKVQRIDQLKRIHGRDYDKKFDADGKALPKAAAVPAEQKPVQPAETKEDHTARLKRLHGTDYDKKFDADGKPLKNETAAETAVPAPKIQTELWFSAEPFVSPVSNRNAPPSPSENDSATTGKESGYVYSDEFSDDDTYYKANYSWTSPAEVAPPSPNMQPVNVGDFETGHDGVRYPRAPEAIREPSAARNLGEAAVGAAVEKPAWYKRFKFEKASKANKPKKHQWEPRQGEDLKKFTARASSRGVAEDGKTEITFTPDMLLAEELRGLTPNNRAEAIARMNATAEAAAAPPSEKLSLKERAKHARVKTASKLRRKRRPTPAAETLDLTPEGVASLNSMFDDEKKKNRKH